MVTCMPADRDSGREFFLQVWAKHNNNRPLEPLEDLVLGVILDHPEYHPLLEQGKEILEHEYTPARGETNPFLHMGLHIAIREQAGTDRPAGIAGIYKKLLAASGSAHDVEHHMMECLGESLWLAQRNNTLPDEAAYLECLYRLL